MQAVDANEPRAADRLDAAVHRRSSAWPASWCATAPSARSSASSAASATRPCPATCPRSRWSRAWTGTAGSARRRCGRTTRCSARAASTSTSRTGATTASSAAAWSPTGAPTTSTSPSGAWAWTTAARSEVLSAGEDGRQARRQAGLRQRRHGGAQGRLRRALLRHRGRGAGQPRPVHLQARQRDDRLLHGDSSGRRPPAPRRCQKAEQAFLKDAKIKLYVSKNHLADFLDCVKVAQEADHQRAGRRPLGDLLPPDEPGLLPRPEAQVGPGEVRLRRRHRRSHVADPRLPRALERLESRGREAQKKPSPLVDGRDRSITTSWDLGLPSIAPSRGRRPSSSRGRGSSPSASRRSRRPCSRQRIAMVSVPRLSSSTARPPSDRGLIQTSTSPSSRIRTPCRPSGSWFDGNHLAVQEDVADLGRHGREVVARHERGRHHRPEAEVRAALGEGHAAVADLEHVGVVPAARARVRVEVGDEVEDVGDADAAPLPAAVPAVLDVAGRPPEVADARGPGPGLVLPHSQMREDDRASRGPQRAAHAPVGLARVLALRVAPVVLQVVDAPLGVASSRRSPRGPCCPGARGAGELARVRVEAELQALRRGRSRRAPSSRRGSAPCREPSGPPRRARPASSRRRRRTGSRRPSCRTRPSRPRRRGRPSRSPRSGTCSSCSTPWAE